MDSMPAVPVQCWASRRSLYRRLTRRRDSQAVSGATGIERRGRGGDDPL